MQAVLSPYPGQLSDDAIAAFLPKLPPLLPCATPIHSAEAARLHQMFTDAADDMQRAALTLRNIWQEWQSLPVCPAALACRHALEHCADSMVRAEARMDDACILDVFERHKGGSAGLSKDTLMSALKEVEAPILATDAGSSAESVFRIADVFAKGEVDIHKFAPHSVFHAQRCSALALRRRLTPHFSFKRVANTPDDIELFLADHGLQRYAPALRALVASGDDQLKSFSDLNADMLHAAVDSSAAAMKRSLCAAQRLLKSASDAQVQLDELLAQQPGKFSIFKASGGTIDAFHKGLLHRIGDAPSFFDRPRLFLTKTLQDLPVWSSKRPCARSIVPETAAATCSSPRTTISQRSLEANGFTLSGTRRASDCIVLT